MCITRCCLFALRSSRAGSGCLLSSQALILPKRLPRQVRETRRAAEELPRSFQEARRSSKHILQELQDPSTKISRGPQEAPKTSPRGLQTHPRPRKKPYFSSGFPMFLRFKALGPSRRRLGASWRHLGASWRLLGPSWRHLGPSWARLGLPKPSQDSSKTPPGRAPT